MWCGNYLQGEFGYVLKEAFVRDKQRIKSVFPSLRMAAGAGGRIGICILMAMLVAMLFTTGCGTTSAMYRKSADRVAERIVENEQERLLGSSRDFNIDRPGDVLRQRLLVEQDLLQSGRASLGAYNLEKISFWPERKYPVSERSGASEDGIALAHGEILNLTLMQALQVGALNSAEYQKMKEQVFQAALDVDLQRSELGFTVEASGSSQLTADNTVTQDNPTGRTVKTESSSGTVGVSKTLKNGARLATSVVTTVGLDIVSLLSGDTVTTKGITGDASISIPLLRGAGRHIAAESLTQAEQNLVYALFQFERYKKTYAVNVVTSYLNVLQQSDQIDNAAENYRNLITSTRRTQRLADAGRSTVIEVNQSLQEELTARARWISAMQKYTDGLDSFKTLLGLPADADIELDRTELDKINEQYATMAEAVNAAISAESSSAEELAPPSMAGASRLEMDEGEALRLAFENRLDLRVSEGKVFDAQRAVVIKANALLPEVTLLGSATTSSEGTTSLDLDQGKLSALLTIDLPIERTSERNAYRNSYIALEQAVRNFQSLEDDIKLAVRQNLTQMQAARESVAIQTRAVSVAQNRAKSTDMFFEAGRSELRDLLEAQEALLTARNSLTSAVVQYRTAELQFQRDTGILKIDDKGFLVEYSSTGE
jgi:outer membrane protein TolC